MSVRTVIVGPEEGEVRLDRWFRRHFPALGHGQLARLLRTGQIRVDGKRAKISTRVSTGAAIRVPPMPTADPEDRPVDVEPKPLTARQMAEARSMVLYRDDWVIVIDKPAGLAVQGGTNQARHLDGMLDALCFDGDRPKLVHRLDKDTSGVMILARHPRAAQVLTGAFRQQQTRKIYWAVTVGVPKPAQGQINLALSKQAAGSGERVGVDEADGKRATTVYSVIDQVGRDRVAWVALWPRTGRTHQLRVHMAELGTPILGDGKYGGPAGRLSGEELPKKLHLHARRLILDHPSGKGIIDVTAPLPTHMRPAWDLFGFSSDTQGDPFVGFEP